MMAVEPLRITEERAVVAARLAMVPALTVFPPVTALTRLVLTERATEDAALVAAFCAVLATWDWAFFSFLAGFSSFGSAAAAVAAVAAYHFIFVFGVLQRPHDQRGHDAVLPDALYQCVHFFIVLYLVGVILKGVQFFYRQFRRLCFQFCIVVFHRS